MKYLVIVESPSKCKKIEKYLNDNDSFNIYEVIATMGHITELKSLNNIEIDNFFFCKHELIEKKRKNTNLINKKIKLVDEVLLFLDNDREGEGIAYMVCKTFHLDVMNTKRFIFNEITESAIIKSLQNPTTININLVNAQQTRQILDLLVGFKVSPILWKYITIKPKTNNPLSAGRCQIPALKLIYDNQMEINNSNNSNTNPILYNTIGYFTNNNIPFELNKQFTNPDDLQSFLKNSIHFSHTYTCSQPKPFIEEPPFPFITSTLQQVASNVLHFSPKETMQICQKLYEEGFITYMRTDNKSYSKDFIKEVNNYILNKYDSTYLNIELQHNIQNKPNDAHEAIRPTKINRIELPEIMSAREHKMYKLIWINALESCMNVASYHSITASISTADSFKYIYKSDLLCSIGWKIVKNKETKENKTYYYLQSIIPNTIMNYKKISANVTIVGNKLHFTEAKLIQLLEEKGIGRPSTYSSIIEKIKERDYVKLANIESKTISCKEYELEKDIITETQKEKEYGSEKNKLIIQPLGSIVIEFLNKNFENLFNYNFTKELEIELDKISKSEISWIDVCNKCNNIIDYNIKMIVKEINQDKPLEGKEQDTLLENSNNFSLEREEPDTLLENSNNFSLEREEPDTLLDKTNKEPIILGIHNNHEIILKKGRYGLYMICGEKQISLKKLGNRPIENIKLADVIKFFNNSNSLIRIITSELSIRKGPTGDYLFYKTLKMKQPKFYTIKKFLSEMNENYVNCNLLLLKEWIHNEYNIRV
jgi:DNA topoisomerase-1